MIPETKVGNKFSEGHFQLNDKANLIELTITVMEEI